MRLNKFCNRYKLEIKAVIGFLISNSIIKRAKKHSVLSIQTQKDLCKAFNIQFKPLNKIKVDLGVLRDWIKKAKNQNNNRTILGAYQEKKFKVGRVSKFIINTPIGGQVGFKRKMKRK